MGIIYETVESSIFDILHFWFNPPSTPNKNNSNSNNMYVKTDWFQQDKLDIRYIIDLAVVDLLRQPQIT